MISEHEKVFTIKKGYQIKVTAQMFTVKRGIGCSIKYIHIYHSSTDCNYWKMLTPEDANLILTPSQLHIVDYELWLKLQPVDPMVTFL